VTATLLAAGNERARHDVARCDAFCCASADGQFLVSGATHPSQSTKSCQRRFSALFMHDAVTGNGWRLFVLEVPGPSPRRSAPPGHHIRGLLRPRRQILLPAAQQVLL